MLDSKFQTTLQLVKSATENEIRRNLSSKWVFEPYLVLQLQAVASHLSTGCKALTPGYLCVWVNVMPPAGPIYHKSKKSWLSTNPHSNYKCFNVSTSWCCVAFAWYALVVFWLSFWCSTKPKSRNGIWIINTAESQDIKHSLMLSFGLRYQRVGANVRPAG